MKGITKVAIAGSRNFKDLDMVREYLWDWHPACIHIVTGGAEGPDSVAEEWARDNKLPLTVIKPDWAKHGKKAGILRNIDIVSQADEVVAFWDGESRGTKSTIEFALAQKKNLMVYFNRR